MRVRNVTARLVICAGLDIAPGAEATIPEAKAAEVRKATVFQNGFLQEIGGGRAPVANPKPAAKPKGEPMRMSVKEAIAVIDAETDFAKLSAWADTETRPDVIEALHKRAEAIAKENA